MIESTHDYENWRDSLRDNPMPEADEHQVRFYSHDYTADTTLEYTAVYTLEADICTQNGPGS